jgi:hypothetical protein
MVFEVGIRTQMHAQKDPQCIASENWLAAARTATTYSFVSTDCKFLRLVHESVRTYTLPMHNELFFRYNPQSSATKSVYGRLAVRMASSLVICTNECTYESHAHTKCRVRPSDSFQAEGCLE